jgi:hypothetical protein
VAFVDRQVNILQAVAGPVMVRHEIVGRGPERGTAATDARTSSGLEVEGSNDGRVVGLGIFPVDSEGGGLVVQDLVVDF